MGSGQDVARNQELSGDRLFSEAFELSFPRLFASALRVDAKKFSRVYLPF